MSDNETPNYFEVGRQAFLAGEPGIPALSVTVRRAIEGLQVGGGAADIMREWQRGWDSEHDHEMAAVERELFGYELPRGH